MSALDLGDVSERPEVPGKERSVRWQHWTSEMSVKDLRFQRKKELDLGDVSERPEVSGKERSVRCQHWTSEMSVKDLRFQRKKEV